MNNDYPIKCVGIIYSRHTSIQHNISSDYRIPACFGNFIVVRGRIKFFCSRQLKPITVRHSTIYSS